jgi:lipoprotein-anchoring transpeptidase ErfK/SrfK
MLLEHSIRRTSKEYVAMQRPLRVALLVSALGVSPAVADPFSSSRINGDLGQPPGPNEMRPVRAAQPGSGGLIEFIFGGAPRGTSRTASDPARASVAYAPQGSRQDPYSFMRSPEQASIDPRYERQLVDYDGGEASGTIIIDTRDRFLYLIEAEHRALRYGIGVGRPGFAWSGTKHISMKREWPDWVPPDDMLKRRPDLPRYMPGGPENPLGARAMYLGSSLYRIHGSNEPWTIGTAVSSGCIRMRNEDVIDLYDRVRVGTKVVVI